jgi:hypothetical protein
MNNPVLFTLADPSFCLLLAILAAMALGPLAWIFACWYLGRAKKQDEQRWVERVR